MLGKLQPRFHLMGEAVWDAHKLESSADSNRVRVSENVQQLLADFLPSLIHVQRDKEGRDPPGNAPSEPDPSIGLHRRKKKSSKARETRGQKEGRWSGGSRGGTESKESKLAMQSMSEVPEAQAQESNIDI